MNKTFIDKNNYNDWEKTIVSDFSGIIPSDTKPTFVKGLSRITSNAPNAIGNAMQSKLIVANVLLLIYFYIFKLLGLKLLNNFSYMIFPSEYCNRILFLLWL